MEKIDRVADTVGFITGDGSNYGAWSMGERSWPRDLFPFLVHEGHMSIHRFTNAFYDKVGDRDLGKSDRSSGFLISAIQAMEHTCSVYDDLRFKFDERLRLSSRYSITGNAYLAEHCAIMK